MLLRKLSCLLVPAILAASMAPRGSAQPGPALDPRFAFADTTLLRDTLGIHFDRLFQLAESARPVQQGVDDQQRPPVADAGHRFCQRGVGIPHRKPS